MRSTRRQFLLGSSALAAATALPAIDTATAATPVAMPNLPGLPPPDPVVHALRRTSFGIRADEFTQATTMGGPAWITAQLAYENISDTACENAVAQLYPGISTTPAKVVTTFGTGEAGYNNAITQLMGATLYRQLYSKRQLFQMMARFWTDHFNIHYRLPTYNSLLKVLDDRDVIRRHAIGLYPTLLMASAKSPAMLAYLDGVTNIGVAPNENYARELLELYTLGIDGGYTEQDIREVARCFTGWTFYNSGSKFATFRFDYNQHDTGTKRVLGTTIRSGGGVSDGETVIKLLASHPNTAYHLARKMVAHFVSDDPPTTLVNAVAAKYATSGGNIREMLRTIFAHDLFWASADQKFARPQDFLSGMMRVLYPDPAAYGSISNPVLVTLIGMGNMYFYWPAPDGYPDRAGYWANSHGMFTRWRFAAQVCERSLSASVVNQFSAGATTVEGLVDQMASKILHRPLSAEHRDSLIRFASFGQSTTAVQPEWFINAAGAMLGTAIFASPYFMTR